MPNRLLLINLLQRFKKIHNEKYDYKLVNFINTIIEIEIICNKCKELGLKNYIFWQLPKVHLKGHGCPICAIRNKPSCNNESHEWFIEKFNKNKNPKVKIIGQYAGIKNKIEVECLICHKHYNAVANNILQNHGFPICNQSGGEDLILKFLKNNNILYTRQKTFKDCKNIYVLRFDFYLPDYNILVEFDGQQHFKPTFGMKPFKLTKHNDKIKNKYCKNNNIKLIRIKYTKIKLVNTILGEIFEQ